MRAGHVRYNQPVARCPERESRTPDTDPTVSVARARPQPHCRRNIGPATEAAVKAFQTGQGITPDGILSPQTWAALIIQVKNGSSGDAVRGVQEEFQFRAGEPGKGLQVDGIFGPQTDSTIRGFRHALSLDIPSVVVDGIVGPITWQALVSGMLSG
jgi:peptidoglycan hydrolase-like protein with peptidoglycan-binding domain